MSNWGRGRPHSRERNTIASTAPASPPRLLAETQHQRAGSRTPVVAEHAAGIGDSEPLQAHPDRSLKARLGAAEQLHIQRVQQLERQGSGVAVVLLTAVMLVLPR